MLGRIPAAVIRAFLCCASRALLPSVFSVTFPVLPLVLLLGLSACGSNAPAPVEDRHQRAPRAAPVVSSHSSKAYRVTRGDTLYSIAFRYGLDFRRLAAANKIPSPYTIYPGQSLVLREADLPRFSRPVTYPKPALKIEPKPAPRWQPTAAPKKPPATVQTQKPVPRPAPKTTPATSTRNAPSQADAPYLGAPVKAWRWPTAGKIVRRYSGSVHKGIDINGRRGDPVNVVAAGKVVYAGTGIVGLGELIIVKHNDIYLSAYGHNDTLLVAEGDILKAGQLIARKGSSGTDRVKLHFEIRKAGKPIDPQRVLSRR